MIVFIIQGLRLIRYSKGFLLAMPKTKRRGKGKPYDATCPITREARRMIEDVVDGGVPESMGETVSVSQTRSTVAEPMPFTISACWTKRLLFLIVSHEIAFAEGYYLVWWGLDWLLPTVGISAVFALLWVRESRLTLALGSLLKANVMLQAQLGVLLRR
jgi:DNA-binding cell septation regulator SpoVG